MSLPGIEWAWRIQVSPTQKLVALALADHANEECECWPSLGRIAQRTGLSKTAIKEAMNALERAQLVIRNRDSGRRTRYRLNLINGQQTRPADGLGRETARPGDGPTRPSGGPELGRETATNRNKNRKEPKESHRARDARGARLAHEALPHEWRAWANSNAPSVDADDTFACFADYWRAQPGQKGVKADWFATWRNWIRREAKTYGTATHRNGGYESRAERSARMQRDAEARAERSYHATRLG